MIRFWPGGEAPKFWPGRRFRSALHDERVAAWLGTWLGISFAVAFVTGLISHFMQHPADWMVWPSRPVNLYRVTQGIHVIGGLATIPLLLAKLWTVYPKLWQWPPLRSLAQAVQRPLIFLLVAGSLFQLLTGLFNIAYWYPFPFFFPVAHYWTSYVVIGALIIHVTNEWAKVRRHIIRLPLRPSLEINQGHSLEKFPSSAGGALSRRGFFATVATASGLVALTTVGETFRPMRQLALLAPRRPDEGPQGLPVNKTAIAARVSEVARDPAWTLVVTGGLRRELRLSLADLRRLPQRTVKLPIACVEGWSADGTWGGVRLRDILRMAGVSDDAQVRVESLQRQGLYRSSEVAPPHWRDPLTLLALDLNGQPLALDHGYPCRLIAPNRPGVLQTKWISMLVIK